MKNFLRSRRKLRQGSTVPLKKRLLRLKLKLRQTRNRTRLKSWIDWQLKITLNRPKSSMLKDRIV